MVWNLKVNVPTIDSSANTLTLDSYPTISISFNDALTELEGISSFSAITAATHIKIRGRMLEAASCNVAKCVLATQLAVVNASAGSSGGSSGSGSSGASSSGGSSNASTELQGPIDNIIPGQNITVLGVTIDITSITSFSGDGITDSTTFFNNVKIGHLVDITGTQTGATIVWQAIELEN